MIRGIAEILVGVSYSRYLKDVSVTRQLALKGPRKLCGYAHVFEKNAYETWRGRALFTHIYFRSSCYTMTNKLFNFHRRRPQLGRPKN